MVDIRDIAAILQLPDESRQVRHNRHRKRYCYLRLTTLGWGAPSGRSIGVSGSSG